MPRTNNNLISTKITADAKKKLEVLKALYLSTSGAEHLAKGDYTALEALIDREYGNVKHLIERAIEINSEDKK